MAGKELLTTEIKRDKTKLYYCGTSKDGFITVCMAQMKRKKKESK